MGTGGHIARHLRGQCQVELQTISAPTLARPILQGQGGTVVWDLVLVVDLQCRENLAVESCI